MCGIAHSQMCAAMCAHKCARQCALTNVRGIVNCERHCELCAALCAHNCVNVEEVISVEEVMSQFINSLWKRLCLNSLTVTHSLSNKGRYRAARATKNSCFKLVL